MATSTLCALRNMGFLAKPPQVRNLALTVARLAIRLMYAIESMDSHPITNFTMAKASFPKVKIPSMIVRDITLIMKCAALNSSIKPSLISSTPLLTLTLPPLLKSVP
ncbi:hypothetical protein V8G54_010258 [Vigna mungo]|uniref:Uncharacterized protein n=1 Tax=Vigna mungo TaxID=3915 RepID=A0AAQ3NVF9_VIGMU